MPQQILRKIILKIYPPKRGGLLDTIRREIPEIF